MISVGIDVSKGSSMVCILKPYGEVVKKPFKLKHTIGDLSELVKEINNLDEEVRVILEATGIYHIPILTFLQKENIFVSVINPMLMKKYATVSIRKGKTDKMDALKIAKFGLDYWLDLIEYHVDNDSYYELRYLSRQYFQFMELRIKQKVMLSNYLEQTMPGLDTILVSNSVDFTRDKAIDFACKYQHYDKIVKMGEKRFISSYMKWTKKEGYQFNEQKAQQLFQHAQNSIPSLPSSINSFHTIFLEMAKGIQTTGATLNIILARMQELAKSLPEYSIVRSMPGVGDKLAPRLIAEIGDIRKYYSGKALVAYAGIDAPPFESGQFIAEQRHISKRGSRYLRKVGFEAMKCIKCREPNTDRAVYDFIIKKERQGKAKKQAMIAGLNKFLRIYYARVNNLINT